MHVQRQPLRRSRVVRPRRNPTIVRRRSRVVLSLNLKLNHARTSLRRIVRRQTIRRRRNRTAVQNRLARRRRVPHRPRGRKRHPRPSVRNSARLLQRPSQRRLRKSRQPRRKRRSRRKRKKRRRRRSRSPTASRKSHCRVRCNRPGTLNVSGCFFLRRSELIAACGSTTLTPDFRSPGCR
jgi:hypothetical protein